MGVSRERKKVRKKNIERKCTLLKRNSFDQYRELTLTHLITQLLFSISEKRRAFALIINAHQD